MSNATEEMLDRAWEALRAGRNGRARSLARRAARDRSCRAEALHIQGRIALDTGRPAEALALLDEALATGGDWPDLYYDLGLAHEDLGHERERVEAFLEVHRLDPAWDTEVASHLSEEELTAVAEQLLDELPEEMSSKLSNSPIIVEDRPTRDLVVDGFDPRALGLFDGLPYSEQGLSGPALNRIVLYRANIAAATLDANEAREQVRITLLHETAHFFGLDEAAVADLGLA
jgi:predicted Zn-dependent protease with MMP-like domain